ncbi:type II toxin-antitoxin system VapC family toxin [Paenibacillus sp. YN15]|uniref:type II toxin-antitoxin system VapC family toxin n=1 Tax=Paenibacillus sp. YN15 TaxID=1742774 RepID=UPI0015EB5BD3|nr:type II toxin-antitoxin system VapC family toxin [Paenibacillus sp. YN15]
MSKYLFDTNVCIYFFREFPPVVRFMEELFQQNEQHEKLLSVITEAELLSVSSVATNHELKLLLQEFINDSDQVVEVNREIANLSGEIRSKLAYHYEKKVKLPDVLIAATALHTDAILVSNNDKDFQTISTAYNLKYINPIQDQDELKHFLATQ